MLVLSRRQIRSGPDAAVQRRIVVVEDGTDNREILRALLELSGHQVTTAADGQAGLDAIASVHPDVALVDIGLPLIDGHEIARRIRELPEYDDVYLIALTGYSRPEDRRAALGAGFDAHLVKPVDFNELTSAVSDRDRSPRENRRPQPASR